MGARGSGSRRRLAVAIPARATGRLNLVLTARQVGKTTVAAWAMAHFMLYTPGGLSVIACPSQRQSAEAVRRVKDHLLTLNEVDNVYGLELKSGSRVLALPSSDDLIRGLTVDGWIVADEAARLTDDLIWALRPMRARRPQARLAMLSTAYSRTDPFWTAWAGDDPSWMRLKATARCPGVVPGGISRTGTAGFGGASLQPGISRNSRWRICQPIRLGFVRARHPNSRAAGAARFGLCAAR